LTDKIVSQVKFEIEQIDQLLRSFAGLLTSVQENTPDLVQVTALASVLHSFYNGLENMFLSIAKGVDDAVPTGAQWHRDLLTQMTKATSNRGPVLTDELAHQLAGYLGFRHFYRHAYSFFLEWSEVEKLVTPLEKVWDQVKAELELFLEEFR